VGAFSGGERGGRRRNGLKQAETSKRNVQLDGATGLAQSCIGQAQLAQICAFPTAVTDLSRKAEGLGVPGVRVDGMDVLAVRETVAEHIRIAREDRQPTLVEAFTYRYRGHSAADPEV